MEFLESLFTLDKNSIYGLSIWVATGILVATLFLGWIQKKTPQTQSLPLLPNHDVRFEFLWSLFPIFVLSVLMLAQHRANNPHKTAAAEKKQNAIITR